VRFFGDTRPDSPEGYLGSYNSASEVVREALVPIWCSLDRIVIYNLAVSGDAEPVFLRARGVRGTQHSVKAADAGSNPAGSILPVVVEKFIGEKTQR
jgi:hypothetical protein